MWNTGNTMVTPEILNDMQHDSVPNVQLQSVLSIWPRSRRQSPISDSWCANAKNVQNTTAPLLNVTRQLSQSKFDTKMGGKCIHKSRQHAPCLSCPCENSQPGSLHHPWSSMICVFQTRLNLLSTQTAESRRGPDMFSDRGHATEIPPCCLSAVAEHMAMLVAGRTEPAWQQVSTCLYCLLHEFFQATIPSYFNPWIWNFQIGYHWYL